MYELQQYLPFTVLKLKAVQGKGAAQKLQQYLPFTVLKPELDDEQVIDILKVATVLTVYGIETR